DRPRVVLAPRRPARRPRARPASGPRLRRRPARAAHPPPGGTVGAAAARGDRHHRRRGRAAPRRGGAGRRRVNRPSRPAGAFRPSRQASTVEVMTALVVYESMYGSTKAIAEAIGEGLAPAGPIRVEEVSALAVTPGSRTISPQIDLLVVGAPTHAFGLSRPNTRQDAAADAPGGSVISSGKGMREWLAEISLPLGGTLFAAFDTKVVRPSLPGSAAK